jgi:glycosyltransferase involved in cell wall biosynthesis
MQEPQSDKIKRVLVLTTTYPSNEVDPSGIFIAKLLAALKNRGYALKVVAPSNGITYGRGSLNGIETVRFGYFWPRSLERLTTTAGGIPENMAKSRLAKIQVFTMMAAFLVTCLRELRGMDIIYANWIGAGIIGAVANLITGKPLVVSFRGDDGYLARDRFLWRVLTKWVVKRSSFVAPVSGELRDIIVGLGTPAAKCYLPKFGVDTQMFHPEAGDKFRTEHVEALFVGSLIVRKGLHDLLNALADPDFERVRLSVVGEGVYEPELRALAHDLGLDSRISWLGTLPQTKVAELMCQADLLCLPSYMEGRPNVVNEAMASGIPVISTTIGGIPDMVIEGENALLFAPGNVETLRECLKRLVEDSELRVRMGKAGREFLINSGVSWDATAEEFDMLFSRITGGDKRQGS